METKKKFLELKKAWINAKDNPDLRAKIDSEMDAFFSSLTDEQRGEVIQATDAEFGRIRALDEALGDVRKARSILRKMPKS